MWVGGQAVEVLAFQLEGRGFDFVHHQPTSPPNNPLFAAAGFLKMMHNVAALLMEAKDGRMLKVLQ